MSDPAPPPYAAGTTIADVLGHPDTPRGDTSTPAPTPEPTPTQPIPQSPANPYNFQQSWTSPTHSFSSDSLFDHIVNTTLDQAGSSAAAQTGQTARRQTASNNFDPSSSNENDLSTAGGGNPLKSSIF